MNIEEIKEILDYIDDRVIPNEKWNKVKDYITNLQEKLDFMIDKNDKKQCKIDKAIKFIENNMYENYCYCGSEDKLLEILKGGE